MAPMFHVPKSIGFTICSERSAVKKTTNEGSKGAVYHIYNMHRLEAIPRRYTVEAGKSLSDEWEVTAEGLYDLEVYGLMGIFKNSLETNKHSTSDPAMATEI